MKNNTFLIFLTFILLGCVRSERHIWNPYTAEYSDVFCDKGLPNPLNNNNKIYISNAQILFDYSILIDGDEKKIVTVVDTCNQLDGICFSYIFVPANSLSNFYKTNHFPIEELKMTIFSSIGLNHSASSSQTLFKYEALNKIGIVKTNTEVTGVIEDESEVMIHSPRSLGFEVLQICPIPKVILKTGIKESWNSTMYIPKESLKNIKVVNGLESDLKLFSTYIIDTVYNENNVDFYKISANFEGNNIKTDGTFYFDTVNGFTDMTYSIGDSIVYNLKKIL